MILIMSLRLVLLTRIIAQVSASKVSATMTAAAHQQQVLPVVDFTLMPFPLLHERQFLY
jgi:hypothetical protein